MKSLSPKSPSFEANVVANLTLQVQHVREVKSLSSDPRTNFGYVCASDGVNLHQVRLHREQKGVQVAHILFNLTEPLIFCW